MTRELRIYGPPGTGKTTHLKGRVEATVRARGEASIRIASLTRAAAAEIGSRVDLPEGSVGTLHAHAYRALEQPDLAEAGDGIAAWNREASKLGEAFKLNRRRVDLNDAAGEAMAPSTEAEGLLQTYQTLRARCHPRELWPADVRMFADRWEEWKKKSNRFDFNDLIERCITDVPHMPGTPSVFLLDEAQDMSRLDMQLARTWGESCDTFVVVGDPDQNLYGFRGAEPEAFTGVQLDDDRVQVLDRSYRVPAAVHGYAVQWLEDSLPTRSGAAYHPRLLADGTEAPGDVRRSAHVLREPEAHEDGQPSLVDELEEHLANGKRVMVLASCGYMLDPIIAVLRRLGIPFGNPYATTNNRLNPLVGGAERILAFRKPIEPPENGGGGWTWGDVRRWMEPLKADGVFERGAKSFVDAKCDGKVNRFEDIRKADQPAEWENVLELVTPDHRMHVALGDLGWYEQHLLGSKAGTLAYGLAVAARKGVGALRQAPKGSGPGVIVGTVHSVKGGEADIVYAFPDLSRTGYAGWLTPGMRHDAVARMLYVAFTRAREQLVLGTPSSAYSVSLPVTERTT